ncbi:discoidin domain-containing receptor 2-like isoform X2 [Oratosquilla oratoria]|uniref:discoidin domain-containing receptor 2-like isoform X2 n=1 Tax=Oratosquilla oratoria TaxID=337810 RepID=UPI003F75EC0C
MADEALDPDFAGVHRGRGSGGSGGSCGAPSGGSCDAVDGCCDGGGSGRGCGVGSACDADSAGSKGCCSGISVFVTCGDCSERKEKGGEGERGRGGMGGEERRNLLDGCSCRKDGCSKSIVTVERSDGREKEFVATTASALTTTKATTTAAIALAVATKPPPLNVDGRPTTSMTASVDSTHLNHHHCNSQESNNWPSGVMAQATSGSARPSQRCVTIKTKSKTVTEGDAGTNCDELPRRTSEHCDVVEDGSEEEEGAGDGGSDAVGERGTSERCDRAPSEGGGVSVVGHHVDRNNNSKENAATSTNHVVATTRYPNVSSSPSSSSSSSSLSLLSSTSSCSSSTSSVELSSSSPSSSSSAEEISRTQFSAMLLSSAAASSRSPSSPSSSSTSSSSSSRQCFSRNSSSSSRFPTSSSSQCSSSPTRSSSCDNASSLKSFSSPTSSSPLLSHSSILPRSSSFSPSISPSSSPSFSSHSSSTSLPQRMIFASLILLAISGVSTAFDLASCNAKLGMESGLIKDDQLHASSSFDRSVTGPASARLNVDKNGGAWCPKEMVGKDEGSKDYLEIDLKTVHVISATETQGRFGNGQGVEYVELYMIEYWRPGLSNWYTYKLWNNVKVLKGNVNTYTAVRNNLMPPILASKIRIIPYSVHPRVVCMRVELCGCKYTEGLVSYSMPQGHERGLEVDLTDLSYDGTTTEGQLFGGIGQLHNGVVGDHNFRSDNGFGKGYEWVGWKNDSEKPVEIAFEFENVRNFSQMVIFTNNMFSKDVQVFSSARVFFSVGGKYYNGLPLDIPYMPDSVSEYARNVTLKLHGRVGKFIKLQLYFADRWIMVSEIFIKSVPAVGNFTIESSGSLDLPPPDPETTKFSTVYQHDGASFRTKDHPNMVVEGPRGQEYVALVIGVLVAVIFLLVSAILLIVWRTRRQKAGTITHDIFTGPYGEKRDIVNLKMGVEGDLDKSGLYSEPFHLPSYNSIGGYSTTMAHKLSRPPQLSSPDYTECPSTEYAVPHLAAEGGSYPPPPLPHTKPPMHTLTSFLGKATPSSTPLPPSNSAEPQEGFYAATEIVAHDLQSETQPLQAEGATASGGSGTLGAMGGGAAGGGGVAAAAAVVTPQEIPKHAITLLQQIGEGQFGEVHLGEVLEETGEKRMVAIKTLRLEASHSVRCDFQREVQILARLQDPNIVQVVGVCSREEPLCMVVEYMEHGDLNQFLQAHVAETASPRNTHAKTLSYGCLIYMATQIASGMKYLESLNFVHRDLATRNCLVGNNHIIKISDFGMSRSLYTSDYYRIEGKALLPIRWMAWESILLGKFTTKSDVWAFAVLLWEILTMAREQPYEDLSDELVIENVSLVYHNDARKAVLPQPPNCPKEIYDLMRECWKRSDADRPTFREIHMFLQRKNLGYSPVS